MCKRIKLVFQWFLALSAEKQRWIFYGTFLTILAVPLAIIFDLILGFRIDQIRLDWLPDIILVNFSVAVNLRSLFADKKKKLPEKEESLYDIFTQIAMLLSIIFYVAFYGRFEKLSCPWVIVLLIVAVGSLIKYVRVGLTVIDTAI